MTMEGLGILRRENVEDSAGSGGKFPTFGLQGSVVVDGGHDHEAHSGTAEGRARKRLQRGTDGTENKTRKANGQHASVAAPGDHKSALASRRRSLVKDQKASLAFRSVDYATSKR